MLHTDTPLLSAPQILHSKRRKRSGELASEISELCGLINAANASLLQKIREFDAEELWQIDGACSCAHWLNWKCGIGLAAARERVRVANALGSLPATRERFSTGELSYSKVRAMTRIATSDNEDYLLKIARNGTAFHVETLVRKYRRAKNLQDLQEANEQHEQRELRVSYEPNGAVTITVRLAAEQGAIVRKAIEAAMEQLDREEPQEPDVSAETSGHEAGADVPAETFTHNESTRPTEKESFEKRRADALVAIAESWLAEGPRSSSLGERFQVMLHVSAETLTDTGGEISHLDDGHRVSAETSRRLCCDGGMSRVTKDKQGKLLDIGRKSRIIPPAMRRALRTRDDICRFPGCTHRHFIDGHHIKHWSRGGETRLDNLIQLCRHHHRLVHEGGFTCEKNTLGQVEFRDQAGDLIAKSGYIRPLPPGINITERLQHRFEELHICAETSASQCNSDIDWDLAVGHLYHPPCVPLVA